MPDMEVYHYFMEKGAQISNPVVSSAENIEASSMASVRPMSVNIPMCMIMYCRYAYASLNK